MSMSHDIGAMTEDLPACSERTSPLACSEPLSPPERNFPPACSDRHFSPACSDRHFSPACNELHSPSACSEQHSRPAYSERNYPPACGEPIFPPACTVRHSPFVCTERHSPPASSERNSPLPPPPLSDSDDDRLLSEFAMDISREHRKRKLSSPCDDNSSKKDKKYVRYRGVTVFYFPRAQGFTCVPSQGGSTLGMERRHSHVATFSLAEHAAEQRRQQRAALQRMRAERLLASASDTSGSESEASSSDSDSADEGACFPQPVPARRRRALLRAAGVRRIDPAERDQCRDIRASRDLCGCTCVGACAAPACSCALAGISCQVDRPSFPCACSRDACSNPAGRVEFDPMRVQNHFVRTLMRLSLESAAPAPAPAPARCGSDRDIYSTAPAYHYPDERMKVFHSYPASSFEEFAHPTHISMFNNYRHVAHAYANECPGGASADQAEGLHQAPAAAPSPPAAPSSPATPSPPATPAIVRASAAECAEPSSTVDSGDTFGEIIKKTMIESVIG